MAEKKKEEICCPKFDPKPWEHKKITWKNKKFVKGHVVNFFHMPLNFGGVVNKLTKLIEDNKAIPAKRERIIGECGLFGSNMYVATTKDIKGANNVKLSGVFISKVFEGPFKNMSTYIKEIKKHVKEDLKKPEILKMYFIYPYCPKCAKKYGKNYIVILAQIK